MARGESELVFEDNEVSPSIEFLEEVVFTFSFKNK